MSRRQRVDRSLFDILDSTRHQRCCRAVVIRAYRSAMTPFAPRKRTTHTRCPACNWPCEWPSSLQTIFSVPLSVSSVARSKRWPESRTRGQRSGNLRNMQRFQDAIRWLIKKKSSGFQHLAPRVFLVWLMQELQKVKPIAKDDRWHLYNGKYFLYIEKSSPDYL